MNLRQQLAVALILVVAITIGILVYLGAASEKLSVTTEMPETVIVGEPFDVTLNIENQTDNPQTIISIGLAESLQERGLVIEDTLPDYRTVDQRSIWSEYTFAITRRPVIEPGDTIPLRITMIAHKPGILDGDLTMWVDNDLQATFVEFQLQIAEE